MTPPFISPITYEVHNISIPEFARITYLVHPSMQRQINIVKTWKREWDEGLYRDVVPADWNEMWKITMDWGGTLVYGRGKKGSKSGKWEYEPLPSSRSDAFILRTRFPTAEVAFEFLVKESGK